jgi:predicted peroxiredoxin
LGTDVAKYLLIESRDPWEYGDTAYFYDLTRDLAAAGNQVTLFLIQNGALVARKGVRPDPLAALAGVTVLVDEFSLRERGIRREALAANVDVADVDQLVDLLADSGTKAIWH